MTRDHDPKTRPGNKPAGMVDALATTVPGGKREELESSAARDSSAEIFPPTAWAQHESVVTSARSSTIPPVERGSGQITLSGNRLSESLGREILLQRFTMAGINIKTDFMFRWGNLLVRLDGFDPATNVGYQFVSHADADVVTDHDGATELTLKQLAAEGTVRVLVIHDSEVPTPGDLLDRAEAFLAGIPHGGM